MNLSGAAQGFNQFDATQQAKQAQAVELARVLQAMSIQKQQADAVAKMQELGMAGQRNAGNAFAALPPPPGGPIGPVPQPPMPGASSPGGTPVGGPPPQPAGPPAGGMPPPPAPGVTGAPSGVSMTGSWKPMPQPPSAAPAGAGGPGMAELPPPPPSQQNDAGVVLPKTMSSPTSVAQQLKKEGKSGEEIMATLTAMSPFWTAAQKQELDAAKMQLQVAKEAREFAENRLKDLREEKRLTQGDKRLDQADKRMDQQAEQFAARDERAERRFQAILAKANKADDPNGKLDASDIQFMAGQYLAGDTSVMQNLGRGVQGSKNIVALRGEIRKQAEAKGMTPSQVASAMAEFQGEKAGQRTLGTRTANIEMAATEADSLADLALGASEKLGRTGIKSLNTAIQAVEKGTASPELRKFVAANTSFINAYARAINPQGVGTVADKEHAREMLDVAFSKGDYQAVISQLKSEIAAAKASPGTVKTEMRERFTGTGKQKGGPAVGTVQDGYRFKGGDPANQASWEKI